MPEEVKRKQYTSGYGRSSLNSRRIGTYKDDKGIVWECWTPVGNSLCSFVRLEHPQKRSKTIYDPGNHWRTVHVVQEDGLTAFEKHRKRVLGGPVEFTVIQFPEETYSVYLRYIYDDPIRPQFSRKYGLYSTREQAEFHRDRMEKEYKHWFPPKPDPDES